MANQRRVIRKIENRPSGVVDEQFWPVVLAAGIWCSLMMGLVVVYLPIGARWWGRDARFWLVAIPLVTSLALWILRGLDRRFLRRSLQTSIVLSLIVHLLLFVASLETSVFGTFAQRQSAPRRPRQRPPLVVADYVEFQLESQARPVSDLSKPVPTPMPEPQPKETVERPTPPEVPEQTVPTLQVPEPREVPAPQPNPVPRSRPVASVPRRADEPSQLSRQSAPEAAETAKVAAVPPAPRATPQPAPPSIRDQVSVARQPAAAAQSPSSARVEDPTARLAAAPATRRETASAPAAASSRTDASRPTVPSPAVAQAELPADAVPRDKADAAGLKASRTPLARRPVPAAEVDPVLPLPATTPGGAVARSLPRRNETAPTVPDTAVTPARQPTRPEAAAATSTAPEQLARQPAPAEPPRPNLAASDTAVERSRSTPAQTSSPSAPELSPNVAARASLTAIARATSSPSQNTAQPATPSATAASARAARAPPAVTPESGLAATPPSPSPAAASTTELAGRQVTVNRSDSPARTIGVPAPQAPSSPAASTAVAGPSLPRAENQARTAVPGRASSPGLTRTARAGDVATSRQAAGLPAQVPAEMGAERPPAEPSRLAVTRSLSGIAGVGQSANLDRVPAVPSSPSMLASGAARRAESVQTGPAGPALAPSDAPRRRRMVADQPLPGSPVKATMDAVAAVVADERTNELTASASASLTSNDSRATPAPITAAAGQIEIDLGPARVADAGGFDRAAGGGQPELQFDSPAQQLTRSQPGGTAAVNLTADQVTGVQASPAAPPPGGELSAAATSLVSRSAAAPGSQEAPQASVPAEPAGATGAPRERAASAADQLANQPAPGLNADEEEEERRRLARAAAAARPAIGVAIALPEAPGPTTDAGPPSALDASASAAMAVDRQSAGSQAPSQVAIDNEPGLPGGAAATATGTTLRRSAADELQSAPTNPTGSLARNDQSAAALPAQVVADVPQVADQLAGTAGGDASPPLAAADLDTPGGVMRRASPPAGEPLPGGSPPPGAPTVALDAVTRQRVDSADQRSSTVSRAGTAPLTRAAPAAPQPNTSVASPSDLVSSQPPAADSVAPGDLAEPSALTVDRRASSGISLDAELVIGPAGVGPRVAVAAGVNSRPASRDSLQFDSAPARFLRRDAGGVPRVNTSAAIPTEAFRRRRARQAAGGSDGGAGAVGPQTEEAIELGLTYLAARQLPDGSWTLAAPGEQVALASDTAATALALLAFQGAGYHHRDYKYAPQVSAGLAYLLRNQRPNGDLFLPADELSNRSVWLYSHAIASIALCEAYGMTQDPALADPAQRALDFIVQAQDKSGGGWRYFPGLESDTSVSGWMLMALKSGELAGLEVPATTYDGIRKWLAASQASGSSAHLYRYNPFAPDTPSQRHGRQISKTMTAVGLLMRLYGGWRRDHASMIEGANYLSEHLPEYGSLRDPQRDTYYWYYATQVMFHMGGSHWEKWNRQLRPLLIESQIRQGALAGSWSPSTPVPDRWSPHGGRLYVTTLNLLSLEVYYRHLPLYVDTGK